MPLIETDVPLKSFNTLRLAARARRLAHCKSVVDVAAAVSLARREGWQRSVLGGGSNVLLTGDLSGLVLRMESRGIELVDAGRSHWCVRAAAGESWHGLVMTTLARGWPGLENLSLIPGTVGAAPIQNIGAYGVELDSVFDRLSAYDTATDVVVTLDREACGFGYRDSIFKRGARGRYVILDVTLRLPRKWRPVTDYADVARELAQRDIANPSPQDISDVVIAIRRAKLPDPEVVGNAGSFFKNPVVPAAQAAALSERHADMPLRPAGEGMVKLAAAWLIDKAGWKGRTLGGAAVHERQALVLVNRGGATAADVVFLSAAIRDDVQRRFGVHLEAEVATL